MTFSLRKKHPTIARGPITPARMAVSLVVAWCLIQAGQATAQQIPPQQPAPPDQSVLLAQGRPKTDEEIEFQIKTEMPGPEELFAPRLSEAQFYEQIRQEARKRPGSPKVIFPDDPPISRELYV